MTVDYNERPKNWTKDLLEKGLQKTSTELTPFLRNARAFFLENPNISQLLEGAFTDLLIASCRIIHIARIARRANTPPKTSTLLEFAAEVRERYDRQT